MNIMGLIGDNPKKTEEIAREAVLWYVRKGFTLGIDRRRGGIQR